MQGGESKSQSLQQDSQITPGNSAWLSENVEGFQQCVNETLKLIEQDGNFSEMTAEIYEQKKSALTTQVAELSRMYRVLADQHEHLIVEFSKNCPSLIKKQHLDSSDSSSPQVTQMFTPDQTSNTHKYRTPIGFDAVLSSGGSGFHISGREGSASASSFSLSSDTDSDSFISINKLLISPVTDDALKVKETKAAEVLHKIANLEEEVVSLNTQLQSLADENTKLKGKIDENESATSLTSDLQSQLDFAKDAIRAQNAFLESGKAKEDELQKQVSDLMLLVSHSKGKMEIMGDELKASRKKLSTAENENSKLKLKLSSKRFEETQTQLLQGQLESSQQVMELLNMQVDSHKHKIAGLQEQLSLNIDDITVRDNQIKELNAKLNSWNADIERLKMELRGKCQLIDDLNKDMDSLKQKHDAVMSDRDGVNAQLDTLRAEMCSQDNLIRELETRLKSLLVEHAGVVASFDSAQKVTNELRVRVVELEGEVDRQREVLSDRAEEKREAIRQLSFSLEYYMSGYKQLRQAFIGHRRHAVLTS